MFRQLDLFLSSDEEWETPTPLGTLERSSFNHWSRTLYNLEIGGFYTSLLKF
jgi:hypothetical protein